MELNGVWERGTDEKGHEKNKVKEQWDSDKG